ncbi:MAG: hypothetical protein RLO17_10635 [Cyclobacteriaceae bacterium]
MRFKREISVGELFTAISILISLIGVLYTWNKNQQIAISNEATRMRELSIQAFSNIQQWQEEERLFYNKAEVLIKQVSRSYTENHDRILARDMFWEEVSQLRNELDAKILSKDLRTFHFSLLNKGIDRDSIFITTIALIGKLLEFNHKAYLQETEKTILLEEIQDPSQSAILSNHLRKVNNKYKDRAQAIFREERSL